MRNAILRAAFFATLAACGGDNGSSRNTGTNTSTITSTNTATDTQPGTKLGSFGGSCMIVITAGGSTIKQCLDFYPPAADPASVARSSCKQNDSNIQNTYSEGHCPVTDDLLGKCAKASVDQYFYAGSATTAESQQQACTSGGGTWSKS